MTRAHLVRLAREALEHDAPLLPETYQEVLRDYVRLADPRTQAELNMLYRHWMREGSVKFGYQ